MVACRILSYILTPTVQVEKWISLLEIKHQNCVYLSFGCPLRPIKSIYPATADCTGSFLKRLFVLPFNTFLSPTHSLSPLEWPTRLLLISFFSCNVGVQLCLWQQAGNPQHRSPNEPTMAFQSYPTLLHSSEICQHFLHQTLSSVTSSLAFIAPCSLESPSSATPATCPRLPLASFCSLSAWINIKNQCGRAETEKDGEVCPVAMGYPGLGAALLGLCKRGFFRAQLMSPFHYQLMRHLSKWSCVLVT